MKIKFGFCLLLPMFCHAVSFQFTFGEGFDDTTPTAAVGGNTGTTLGEQRAILFQSAANIWAKEIISDVTIAVDASFSSDLFCDENSAVLGSAGPLGMVNSADLNIPNSVADTYYPLSLANAMTGVDNFPTVVDIVAKFNSKVDTDSNCLTGESFYYGIDDQAVPDGKIPLFSTVLHELAHGLGFFSAIETTDPDGSYVSNLGQQSVFDVFLYDTQANLAWFEMNNTQRLNSMTNNPFLVWSGANVDKHAASYITSGFNSGFIRSHAPSSVESGSSISHFSIDSEPDILMEPILENIKHDQVDVTPFLFEDLGYKINLIHENGFDY